MGAGSQIPHIVPSKLRNQNSRNNEISYKYNKAMFRTAESIPRYEKLKKQSLLPNSQKVVLEKTSGKITNQKFVESNFSKTKSCKQLNSIQFIEKKNKVINPNNLSSIEEEENNIEKKAELNINKKTRNSNFRNNKTANPNQRTIVIIEKKNKINNADLLNHQRRKAILPNLNMIRTNGPIKAQVPIIMQKADQKESENESPKSPIIPIFKTPEQNLTMNLEKKYNPKQFNKSSTTLKLNLKLIELDEESDNISKNPSNSISPIKSQKSKIEDDDFTKRFQKINLPERENMIDKKLKFLSSRLQTTQNFQGIISNSTHSESNSPLKEKKSTNFLSVERLNSKALLNSKIDKFSLNLNQSEKKEKKKSLFFDQSKKEMKVESTYEPSPNEIHNWEGENGLLNKKNQVLSQYYLKVNKKVK